MPGALTSDRGIKKPSTSQLEVDGPLVDSLVFRMNIQFNRVNHVLRA